MKAWAVLGAGVLCLLGSAVPLVAAHADAQPGSGLGSFALSANAPVLQARFDYAAQRCGAEAAGPAGCEGVVNESVAQLGNGPVGYGLSSVAWPGTLGGNLGSLLITAGGGQVPPQATALNSPVRAETHTGDKPAVTDYPPAPAPTAAHMRAEATDTKVTAEAALGGVQQPALGSLGSSTSSSVTELTGVSSARAAARSAVQDITIAGVLHIASVASDATATTDGSTATATGRTVVTGASVNGIPVSIDQDGVTVQSQKVPLPSQATDAVNAALAGAGITVVLSKPHGTPVGASVAYDAGALAILWKPQDGMAWSAEIGGAQVSVASSTAYLAPSFGTVGGAVGGMPAAGGTAAGPAAPPPLSGGGLPGPAAPALAPPPAVSAPGGFAPRTVATRGPFYGGLSPWFGALAAVGAVLVMAGLRRLPDRVLAASPTSCPNGAT